MDTTTGTRRHQLAGPPPRSPCLVRSRSGTAPTISQLDAYSTSRSKSTTKSRVNKHAGENVTNPTLMLVSSNKKKPPQEKREIVVVKFMRARTVSGSPSAWALSPGRSLPCSPLSELPSSGGLRAKSSGGGVRGVLKYFRQKKVSPIQEEDNHRLKILHGRLVQWRFANARAEAVMAVVRIVAEDKLFSVWLQVLKMRNSIVEKCIQMQRLQHEIKLYQIINLELPLLHEWAKLDRKNSEAVSRLVRKLSALSIRLPLAQGAKADSISLSDAMSMAMGIMDSIEAVITKFVSQAGRTSYLLKKLIIILKQYDDYLEELRSGLAIVASLEAREASLRVRLIQEARSNAEAVYVYKN